MEMGTLIFFQHVCFPEGLQASLGLGVHTWKDYAEVVRWSSPGVQTLDLRMRQAEPMPPPGLSL